MSGECLTISLTGGVPWGFRLQGGAGTGQPLVVSKVRRRSKAYRHLREGDQILKVNGLSCSELTYDQVMEIADRSEQQLNFTVHRAESNKENQAPVASMHRPEQKQKIEELNTSTESVTKTINEREGLRIQSATLLSNENDPLKDFSSPKWAMENPMETKVVQPFTPFQELEQSAKTGKPSIKEEKQKVVREILSEPKTLNDMPDITLDTIDLNKLISATQRKLEDFRPGGVSPDMFPESRGTHGYSKSTITSSESQIRTEISEKVTSIQKSETELIHENAKEIRQDAETPVTLPDILPEFSTQSSESSCITNETPFGMTITTKKKKMFSSSSFYEEPQSIYPTVEEQVEMAKKIASSLADDINSKSKGANMFHKRVKRSSKWIHEGPEPSDESAPSTPEIQGVEPPTPDPSQVPFRPSKTPSKLKLVLDPRHPFDASSLKSCGLSISEHNVVSPEVCHGLVKDLHSPVGKGAALFAKRKKKSEEWVVDEEKVKNLLREQERRALLASPAPSFGNPPYYRQDSKLVRKSPWEVAMESPYGLCNTAWVSPDQLADTVMRAADQKRSSVERSLTSPPPFQGMTPVATMNDIYHAKPPKGWPGNPAASEPLAYVPAPSPMAYPESANLSTGYQQQGQKKPVYQNFNAVPRLWKGTTTTLKS